MAIFSKIRKRVDKVVMKLLNKAKKAGRKLLGKLGFGQNKTAKDGRTTEEKEKDLRQGVKEGTSFVKNTKLNKKSEIDEKLSNIGNKYQLQELKLVIDKDNEEGKDIVHVHGKINPEKEGEKIEKDLEGGTALKATDIPVKVNDLIKAKYINGRYLADVKEVHEPDETNKEDFVEHKYRYKKLNGDRAVKNTFKLFLEKWKKGDIEKVNEERKYLIENRPTHKSDFRDKVWAKAPKFTDENGKEYTKDANDEYIKIYRNDNWDAGHKTGSEYRYLVDDYINGNISYEDFLEEYHSIENYQVEDRYQNRSHKNELKRI